MNQQRKIELQVLALHRVLAERIRNGDGAPLAKAIENLRRWTVQFDGHLPAAYRHWQQKFDLGSEAWLDLLEADTDEAARWRSSSPFAGAIDARERWRIFRDAA